MALIAEIQRRKVLQAIAAYAVLAWGAIEVTATVAPLLDMPDWVPRGVTWLAIAGFPVIVTLAWLYDLRWPRLARTAAAPLDAAKAAGEVHSLAVLPLSEIDANPEYPLADGLTEALITDLARVTGLRVISHGSVMRFKDSAEPPRAIAQRLNVDALVGGSVRRGGTRIRISVELIEPTSERVLWAGRYDRELEDVLRVQDEIARAIAGEIQSRVGPDTEAASGKPRQVVPEVYLLYLKGRRLMDARTEEGFRAALTCFQRSLDIDPSYGASYLGIAGCHNMLANYGIELPVLARPRILAALERAAEMGADAAELHHERAQMLWQFDFDWRRAQHEYRSALALAPNNARHCYWFGMMLTVSGRFDAGLEMIARAETLDPLSALLQAGHGWALYFSGRSEEAASVLRDVLALNPDLAPAYWFLGMTLVQRGDHAGAIAAYRSAISHTGRISRLLGYLGHAHGRAGETREAQALLAELQQRASETYVPPYFPALVLAGLGENDDALTQLERALEQRDCMLRDVRVDASFATLRDTPRFRRLIEAMHFPPPGSA